MVKLTKRLVDAAAPRTVAYFLWCGELAGFGVRIHPTGKRVYYVDYRNRNGARKRMAIGAHGKITTEEARKLALLILGSVVKGDDPAADRATQRDALTVAELCANYMGAAEQGSPFGKQRQPKRPSTIAQDRARLVRHIVPLLGSKLVHELTRADVAKFIRDVSIGKTALVEKTPRLRGNAVVRSGASMATRAAGFLGAILTFAVNEGIIEHNPARGVPRQADHQRARRLYTGRIPGAWGGAPRRRKPRRDLAKYPGRALASPYWLPARRNCEFEMGRDRRGQRLLSLGGGKRGRLDPTNRPARLRAPRDSRKD